MYKKQISYLATFLLIFLASIAFSSNIYGFEVDRYEVETTLHPSSNSSDVQTNLKIVSTNASEKVAVKLALYISKDAKVTEVTVDGTVVNFKQQENKRLPVLSDLQIDLPISAAPKGKFDVKLKYTFTVLESTVYAAITPGDVLLLPESFWIPSIHTPFQPHGADTAPYKLSITNTEDGTIFSDGIKSADNGVTIFNSSLSAQPWLAVSFWSNPVTRNLTSSKENPIALSAMTQPGIISAEIQCKNVLDETEKIINFYTQLFGLFPGKQFSVVSIPRDTSYISPTAIIVEESLFQQSELDAENIEFLARGIARAWLGGKYPLRGKGLGILQDALPSYLVGLYFESRFGTEAAQQYWARRIRTYAPLAATRTDTMLISQSSLDSNYFPSMLNKGALVFRLFENQVGRQYVLDGIKNACNESNRELTLEILRTKLVGNNNTNEINSKFFKQWWDEIVEPDFIIGIPQKNSAGGWTCALRNLGSGEVKVPVIAINDKGEKIAKSVTIPSQGISTVEFDTTSSIALVEIDPEKLCPQAQYSYDKNSTQYDNDARPTRPFSFTLFSDATKLFEQKNYKEAEAKLRSALQQDPSYASCRVLLARILANNGRFNDAQNELNLALKANPKPLYVLGWGAFTQGEIAASKKDLKAALQFYKQAATAETDLVCSMTAKKGILELEQSLNQQNIPDESIKQFIEQLDKAIKLGTLAALEPLISKADLPKFIKGIVVSKPNDWKTQIIRFDKLDDKQVAVDVKLDVVSADKKEQKGSTVLVLRKIGNNWKLVKINLFTVQ